MTLPRLKIGDAFLAVPNAWTQTAGFASGWKYHPHLEEIRHYQASGVYAITDFKTRKVLYIGESHSGRLYDTITRHFRNRRVDPANDAQGRRRGGVTYDRRAVRVIYLITKAEEAQAIQYAEIQRLRPRDNTIDGSSVVVEEIPI